MATVPVPENYATEREYAQAFAAFKNLEGARRLASLNLSSDDSQNRGTVSTVADTNGTTTMTSVRNTGQKSIRDTEYIDAPGIRRNNILSEFSSYNYSITLYMVSKEANNEFVSSGGKFPATRSDVYIVAQSAGVNNAAEQRLITKSRQLGKGQQGNDYYIDDLIFNTIMPGNALQGATTSTDIKFKIIEPLGFNFITDLSEMSNKINQSSSGGSSNKFQQNLIIGIKFYGYDINGLPMKSSDPRFSNFLNGSTDKNSVAERYFSILINKFEYSIDERSTEYSIEAAITSEQQAYGQINGSVKGSISMTGRTVRELLLGSISEGEFSSSTSLIQILNQKNQDLKNKGYLSEATTYNIVFLDKKGKIDYNSPIATATLPNNFEVNFGSVPMSSAQTTKDVTVTKSINAQTIDVTKQKVTVTAGTAITQIIDNIITNSSYVTGRLNRSIDQTTESSSKSNPNNLNYESHTINTVTINKGVDPVTNYPILDITYQIIPKEVVNIKSQYVSNRTPYRGPFKYYEYMFTGKNTEILKFDQSFNSQYFLTTATTDSRIISPKFPNYGVTTIPMPVSTGDITSTKFNQGSTIAQDVKTSLYSLKDQVEAKIKIIGDPDYFMTAVGVTQGKINSLGSIYNNSDGSINPFSSQILIEIRFNSPDDYTDKGLLNVRNNIQFYSPENYDTLRAAKISGVVYEVISVESTMSKGSFTQVLSLLLVPDSALIGSKNNDTGRSIIPTTTNSDIRGSLDQEDADIGFAIEKQSLGGGFTEEGGTDVTSPYVLTPPSPNDDKNITPTPKTIPEVTERIEEQNFDFTGIRGITQIIAS
jgi:hypothetical protein